jgi:hypothetical protein
MKLQAICPAPPGWRLYREEFEAAPVVALGLTLEGNAVPLVLLAPEGAIVAASEVPNPVGIFHVEDPERPGGPCARQRAR